VVTSVSDAQEIGAVMTVKRIDVSDSMRLSQPPGQSLFRNWFSLLLFGILLCGSADLMSGRRSRHEASDRNNELAMSHGKGWRLAGSQDVVLGQEQFVLVRKASESDRQIYDDAIKHLCRLDKWCGLHFWSDASLIPNRLPMSNLQTATEVANYTRNPDTGFAQFVWNCRVHQDPLNCFSYK
jgi:hypothetical protein